MKIVRCVSSNIVLWVVLFAIIAFFYPPVFLIFKNTINWFFAGAMFGIGLVLQSLAVVLRPPRGPLGRRPGRRAHLRLPDRDSGRDL